MSKYLIMITLAMLVCLNPSQEVYADTTTFLDTQKHWAKDYVMAAVKNDLAKGYPDGTFRPENNITNAEYLAMTLKAMKVVIPEADQGAKWYSGVYTKALEYELIDKADPNDAVAIYPEDKITREQASRVIAQALKKKEQYAYDEKLTEYIKGYFKDYGTVGKYYLDGLKNTIASGIISGYPDRSFKPSGMLTRGESAVVIGRLFDQAARKPFNPSELYMIRIEGQTPGMQGYEKPYIAYLDKKYGDFVNVFNLMAKENEDMSDGFAELIDNRDEEILSASLYTDVAIYRKNIVEAINTDYFTIGMYYDKNPQRGFEKYQIEISDYNGNATKRPETFEAVLKYLFGKEYPTVLAKFRDMQNGKVPPEGQVYQTIYTLNGRTVSIARWNNCTVIYTTMKSNEPLKTWEQVNAPPVQTKCTSTFQGLQLTANITPICNETVNMLIKEVGKRNDFVILDVRTEAEFNAGHIPYAFNIPLDQLKGQLWKLKPYKYVMVYCKAGGRSAQAAELLATNGFTVMNFADGYDKFELLK